MALGTCYESLAWNTDSSGMKGRLSGANPLPEPMMTNYYVNTWEKFQRNSNQGTDVFFQEMHLYMLSLEMPSMLLPRHCIRSLTHVYGWSSRRITVYRRKKWERDLTHKVREKMAIITRSRWVNPFIIQNLKRRRENVRQAQMKGKVPFTLLTITRYASLKCMYILYSKRMSLQLPLNNFEPYIISNKLCTC